MKSSDILRYQASYMFKTPFVFIHLLKRIIRHFILAHKQGEFNIFQRKNYRKSECFDLAF